MESERVCSEERLHIAELRARREGKVLPCKEQQQDSLPYISAFTQFFYSSMQQRWVSCPSEFTQLKFKL